jgi:hypothetical protein
MSTKAAATDLLVVELSTTSYTGVVMMTWGDARTAVNSLSLYSNPPFSFSAVDANGKEPFFKTFGSFSVNLKCHNFLLF